MKIAMLTHTYLPKIGGREIHVSKLSEALVERGHELIIITSDQGQLLTQKGIQVIKLKEIKLLLSSRPEINYYRILPKLHRVLRQTRCDILHLHDIMHYTTDSVSAFGKIFNIPTVLTIHGFVANTRISDILVQSYNYTLGNVNFYFADRIILPSRALCKTILPLNKFNDKIRVIPNGVEPKDCRAKEISHPIKLLAVGRLVPRKGFQYLIQAMPEILSHFPDAILNIVGPDGGFGSALQKEIDALNLNDSVKLLGKVSDLELNRLYESCSICVNPSIWDNVPLTVLEGLSWGTPIVTCNVGGISEIIKNYYNGLLSPPKNSTELSKAIISLSRDSAFYTRMASNALISANMLSWKRIAAITEKVYMEVLG